MAYSETFSAHSMQTHETGDEVKVMRVKERSLLTDLDIRGLVSQWHTAHLVAKSRPSTQSTLSKRCGDPPVPAYFDKPKCHPSTHLSDGVCVALCVRPERFSGFSKVEELDQAILPSGAKTPVIAQLMPNMGWQNQRAPKQNTQHNDRQEERE